MYLRSIHLLARSKLVASIQNSRYGAVALGCLHVRTLRSILRREPTLSLLSYKWISSCELLSSSGIDIDLLQECKACPSTIRLENLEVVSGKIRIIWKFDTQ